MCLPEPPTRLGRARPGGTHRANLGVRSDHGVGPPARLRASARPEAGTTGDAGDRAWERPGATRRDCLPHRAGLLLALADASLLLGALSPCLGFPALAAFACGAVAWGLACHDLGEMRARRMDPGGLAATRRARARARAGAALGLYGATLWAWFLALLCFPNHR